MKLNEWIQILQINKINRSNNDGIMEKNTWWQLNPLSNEINGPSISCNLAVEMEIDNDAFNGIKIVFKANEICSDSWR